MARVTRPIGIYEWCALTQEMLDSTDMVPDSLPMKLVLGSIQNAVDNAWMVLPIDARDRGEKLLEEQEQEHE